MNSQVKATLVGIYAVIGFLYAVYQHFWGQYNYKSFAYNIGQGLIWPAWMFPSVGHFIGSVLILGIVAAAALRSR